jgi:hypothetical protein
MKDKTKFLINFVWWLFPDLKKDTRFIRTNPRSFYTEHVDQIFNIIHRDGDELKSDVL